MSEVALTQSYIKTPATTPPLDKTIGQMFDETAEKFPDQDGLIVRHQDIHWTYRDYQTQVNRLATGLLALGIEKGDRVGIWAPNCYEWSVTQFATAKIGALLVCVNPAYRLYELEYALNKVDCKALITAESFKSSKYIDMLQELAPELATAEPGALKSEKLPSLTTVIRMGDARTAGMYNFEDVCTMGGDAEHAEMERIELDTHDAINIQFTSGTTGSPKGATLTHHNILNNGKYVGDGMKFTEHDRLCIPVPLYHCFGMVLGNLVCICKGAAAVFPAAGFDPLTTLEAVEAEKCTGLHGVPTMFMAELDHPDFANFDVSTLRTGIMAGATCPVELMKRVQGELHMKEILIGYGQTEASPINHMTATDDPIEKQVGTVGKAGPNLEIKIIDEEGATLPIGEKGEICNRGYNVMLGYWNDDEKSAETVDGDGWLHSGDLGIMDAEGYVQIVGRIKDMIIRGGENIYPREIEEFLYTHPAIQEVQVFGIPDDRMGEKVCAWVQTHEEGSLTAEDIKDFCGNKIAHFKVPEYIRFVTEYPMTVTGKIQKFVMRDMMVKEMSA